MAGKSTKKVAGKKQPAKKPAKAATATAAKRINTLIANLNDWRGARLAEIRTLVHEADPEVLEEWKWMGTPVWSHEGMYVLANAHKDKVKITFFHGARLPDPSKLFNAGLDGNRWRAIDIREGDTLDKPALKALLREAVAYNTTHSVPRSRGSRAWNSCRSSASAPSRIRDQRRGPAPEAGGAPSPGGNINPAVTSPHH